VIRVSLAETMTKKRTLTNLEMTRVTKKPKRSRRKKSKKYRKSKTPSKINKRPKRTKLKTSSNNVNLIPSSKSAHMSKNLQLIYLNPDDHDLICSHYNHSYLNSH